MNITQIHQTDLAIILLKQGKLLCLPTDTLYALAGNASCDEAVSKVFACKQRDLTKPLPLLVANLELARKYAHFSPLAEVLAQNFWPGALTLVLPMRHQGEEADHLALGATQYFSSAPLAPIWYRSCADGYIAIRVPGNFWLREMMLAANNMAITGTSANLSGMQPVNNAEQLAKQLAVLDGDLKEQLGEIYFWQEYENIDVNSQKYANNSHKSPNALLTTNNTPKTAAQCLTSNSAAPSTIVRCLDYPGKSGGLYEIIREGAISSDSIAALVAKQQNELAKLAMKA